MELSRVNDLIELSKKLQKEGYVILTAIKLAEIELTKEEMGDKTNDYRF